MDKLAAQEAVATTKAISVSLNSDQESVEKLWIEAGLLEKPKPKDFIQEWDRMLSQFG